MSRAECAWIERDDVFEGYVRGTLDPEVGEPFEVHLLECEGCYEKARSFLALRAELADLPAESDVAPATARRPPWRWALVPLAAGVCVCVIAIAAWWYRSVAPAGPESTLAQGPAAPTQPTGPSAGGGPQQPSAPPSAPPSVPTVVAMSTLVRVEPPLYVPVVLRAPRDEAAEQFEAAMRHYRDGNYTEALAGLRAADEMRPDAPKTRFFLAVCLLLIGQNTEAAVGFEQTIALGESAYLEEAHFYLAKAFLRLGRLPAARRELQRTFARGGGLEQEARTTLSQLDAYIAQRDRPPDN